MILDNFPKVLWINMDKSVDRRKYMQQLLDSYKINHTRISSINGIDRPMTELQLYCRSNKKLLPSENACTASHFKALKYFIENTTEDKIIIFEDDVSFEFLQYIPFNWSQLEKKFPPNYSVIQLAISTWGGAVSNILVKYTKEKKYYCTAAYLITRKAAIELVDKYFSKTYFKLDLSNTANATSDTAIYSVPNTFSIPIFTYRAYDSTIHASHLNAHIISKNQQLSNWKLYGSKMNVPFYFSKFEKN